MAKDGVWSLNIETGEFVLSEPYASMLDEAKLSATKAWTVSLLSYLVERSDYDAEFLKDELLRRQKEIGTNGVTHMGMVDEFIIEALTGDL